MVRENKDLSLEQAQKIIDKNREANEQRNQQSVFTQFRQETGQN